MKGARRIQRRRGTGGRDRRHGPQTGTGAGAATGAAPAFTPLSLASPQLLLHLGSPSTLRQDAAGTTAVVADGDPIGQATDASPQGRTHTAAGSTRLLYRTAGGGGAMGGSLACGQDDGVDDALVATVTYVLTGAQTWCFDVELAATGGTYQVLSLGNGTASSAIYLLNSGTYQSLSVCFGYTIGGNSVGCGGVSGAGLSTTRRRYIVCYDGVNPFAPSSYAIFVDGVSQTVLASDAVGALPTGSAFGARPNNAVPVSGKLRKVSANSADLRTSFAQLDGWLSAAA